MALLLLSGAAGAMQPALVTVHVKVRQPDTGEPAPGIRVKVGYWRCVLVVACAIKPLAEGTTGPDGEVTLVVERRTSMVVQDLACPEEVTMLAQKIPPDEIKEGEVIVEVTARKVVCRPHNSQAARQLQGSEHHDPS
ncbi:hypothetical protein FIV34_17685 [Luteibacter pinisoli]|uniref:Uncharacterized protein n=1 Tax=Luteibacter pinisoli TaxID=2589080 RepID=A0A4Y5Z634_9GAMM|nr:hypothetical protein [Luteibacter pinisoli]QDE40912.1 hypothetical protein FIV34_17685 [Luteibacter pinisoli]